MLLSLWTLRTVFIVLQWLIKLYSYCCRYRPWCEQTFIEEQSQQDLTNWPEHAITGHKKAHSKKMEFKTRPVYTQSLIYLGGVFGSVQNPQYFVNVLLLVKYRQEQKGREMEETFCSHQLWFSIVQSRKERQKMGGFFSHMCSRFPGRRTMTHCLQALNLSGLQPEIPPPREMQRLWVLICSSPSQPPTCSPHHGISVKRPVDEDHLACHSCCLKGQKCAE